MKRAITVVAAAWLACSALPTAAKVDIDGDACDVDSDYSFRIEPGSLIFTSADKRHVVELMPGGLVRVDGFMLALDAGDRRHVDALERGMRVLIPEVKGIAIEAAGIAFEAVGHASTAFAASPREARESAERIARTARELQKGIEAKQDWDAKADADFDRVVEGAVGALVGEIIGNVTAQAITVALSGDQAAVAEITARAESIEASVEKALKQRGKQLEQRAQALCARIADLDVLESRIDARLPGDRPFDLFNVKHEDSSAPAPAG